MDENVNEPAGMDRRTLIKRGAVVGGSLVWATPVVQSITRPAFAAESPAGCSARVELATTLNGKTTCSCTNFPVQPLSCCECIEAKLSLFGGNAALATIVCFSTPGACDATAPRETCTCG